MTNSFGKENGLQDELFFVNEHMQTPVLEGLLEEIGKKLDFCPLKYSQRLIFQGLRG